MPGNIKVECKDGSCNNAKITTHDGVPLDYITRMSIYLEPNNITRADVELCDMTLEMEVRDIEVSNVEQINERLLPFGYQIIPTGA